MPSSLFALAEMLSELTSRQFITVQTESFHNLGVDFFGDSSSLARVVSDALVIWKAKIEDVTVAVS